jgi:hypothetical protein
LLPYLFCSHKYHKSEKNYFIFELEKNFVKANLHRIVVLFKFLPKKLSPSSKNMGLGSRKNLFRIQDTRKHRIPDPQDCTVR